MSTGDKVCILCGDSCAGQPRIKNEKGQYAHRACVDQKMKSKAEPEPVIEDDYSDALGGDMDDLLGDIAVQDDFGSAASACGGCGQRMAEGAVVCMACGYNAESGKSMQTRSKEQKAGSGNAMVGGALGGAAKLGGFAASPVLPLIGAIIGGAIGAAIWAAIAYFLNAEVGYVALGVGALCGFGATLGGGAQTTGGGMIAGAMAAVVSVGAIAGGKYAASHFAVQNMMSGGWFEPLVLEDIDDDWANSKLAHNLCKERIEAGSEVVWDDPMLFVYAAYWPDDYPEAHQQLVLDKWESLDDDERIALRKGIAADTDINYTYRDVDEEWALSWMADEAATTMIENGESIGWADPLLPLYYATWPEEFPADIVEEVNTTWDAMSADEQLAFKEDIMLTANEGREDTGDIAEEITKQSFIDSFKHPLDLVFLVLAVITAYGIGANEN